MFTEKFAMIKICVFRVKYFFCLILFLIFCLYYSEGFDSPVSLFCFFSISGIAPLIICFDLRFKKHVQKIHNFSYVFQLLCFTNITADIYIVQFSISNT